MSLGSSVGDFIAVGQLAWRVYKSCKDASASSGNIAGEVLSLHAVLKEVEETRSGSVIPESRLEGLVMIKAGCRGVLIDLQSLVDKYQKLGTQTRRTWDGMRWHSEDLLELRSRLTTNTAMLSAFISTSEIVVERRLNSFLREFKDGKYEATVITTEAVESLSIDSKQTWRAVRKELEDIEISVVAFESNKTFIMQ